MHFRHHNQLRVFTIVAQFGSISAASNHLNLTKGAVSQQIRQLEIALGFSMFERLPRGISLTAKGQELLLSANLGYGNIEDKISSLQRSESRALTVGVTTYFASRWLSPRLMDFLQQHPNIQLRIQPMIELTDLQNSGIDLAIRWGDGNWNDIETSLLFHCPAWPCGNTAVNALVGSKGLEYVLTHTTLLHDSENSSAWQAWFLAAGFAYHNPENTLIIPDPNVRVQAVIDGQGIALNDALVEQEQRIGKLHRLCDAELDNYGYYLAWPKSTHVNTDVLALSGWLQCQV